METSFNPMQQRQRPVRDSLQSLDDACLLHIFSFLQPLPDLFNVARSGKVIPWVQRRRTAHSLDNYSYLITMCVSVFNLHFFAIVQRFRDLALARRSWLVVTSSKDVVSQPECGAAFRQVVFPNLHDAVRASRPGDTIYIEPGQTHKASDVRISHPVHLLGGGDRSTECVINGLSEPHATVLTFLATARVSNLTIKGGMGGCVSHIKGKLVVESCTLQCCSHLSLAHMASPFVTHATSSRILSNYNNRHTHNTMSPTPSRTKCENGSKPVVFDPGFRGNVFPGPGTLSVVECIVEGGGAAVRTLGTGRPSAVRLICDSQKVFFWFDVDSSGNVGLDTSRTTRTTDSVEKEDRSMQQRSDCVCSESPSWICRRGSQNPGRFEPVFDPVALQKAIAVAVRKASPRVPPDACANGNQS